VAENLLLPLITLSIESNKSRSEIALRLALIANIPASVQTLLKSAPIYLKSLEMINYLWN
jgi:hypothetical protein